MTRALLVLSALALLGAACGDAKTPAGGKAEVELPAKSGAPAKSDAIAKAPTKATQDDPADAKADAPADPTGAATPTEPGEKGDAKGDAPSGGGDAIGVAECDAYITKYSKCIDTGVPADIRDLMKGAVEHSREAWKKAAAGSGKAELPSICKGALAAAKQATAKYGCSW